MHKLGSRLAVLPAITMAASLVLSPPMSAQAAEPPATVAAVTDSLARRLSTELVRPDVRDAVSRAVRSGPVDLASIDAGASFRQALADANRQVLGLKGLPAGTGSVLSLRLGADTMRAALVRGVDPLVASAPDDDRKTAVTAYETGGHTVRLDARTVPSRPVLVVEVDGAKVLPAGLSLIRSTLAASARSAAVPALTSGGYWATKVDAVRLRDDQEPWI